MPIPKHLRHFYRGPAFVAWRTALLKRSGGKCEQCGKPDGIKVETHTGMNVAGLRMAWRKLRGRCWRDQHGRPIRGLTHIGALALAPPPRTITVVLTAAHLNHTPGDDRVENGKMLCQWCHLEHDRRHHLANSKKTRLDRKDGARPLLEGVAK